MALNLQAHKWTREKMQKWEREKALTDPLRKEWEKAAKPEQFFLARAPHIFADVEEKGIITLKGLRGRRV